MKKFSILSFLLTFFALTSCTQGELTQEDIDNDLKDLYNKAWISQFGLVDINHDWNMATNVKADVDPAAFGKDITLRIYSAEPGKGGCLVGYATRKGTLNLNVAKNATTLYAVAKDKNKRTVSAGYYNITDGKANVNAPSAVKAASRAEGDADDTPNFAWMVACEDLGSIGDFDFNDIVFGVNVVDADGKKQVTITPMAAGGTMEARIYIGSTEVGEIHELLAGEGASYQSMINTTGYTVVGDSKTFGLNSFDISDAQMGGLKIAVTKNTVKQNATRTIITPPGKGEAPQMFLIAGDWEWPSERTPITTAYSGFAEWSKNAESSAWTSNPAGSSTILWKEILKNSGTNTNPDPEEVDPEEPEEPEVILPMAQRMIDSQAQRWSGTFATCTGADKDFANSQGKIWDYVPGLVSKSMLTYCENHKDDDDVYTSNAFKWAKAYADEGLNSDGSFKTSASGKVAFSSGSLDNIASGKVLLSLYNMPSESGITAADKAKYKAAADAIYADLTTNCKRISYADDSNSGLTPAQKSAISANDKAGFWHKSSYPYQMWLDGLYMGAAFYAEYLYTFDKNNTSAWEDVTKQFTIIHPKTKKLHNGHYLNLHAWSAVPDEANSAVWANTTTGCSQNVWGRAMGWYIAALVDVLEYMELSGQKTSDDYTNYTALRDIYREVADGILSVQDASGVWYQLLEYGPEAIGTCRTPEASTLFNDDYTPKDAYNSATDLTKSFYPLESSKAALSNNDYKNKNKFDQPGTKANYLEASASCMFTYGLIKGLRLGLIEDSNVATYEAAAYRAYEGLLTQFITGGETPSINNICKSAGLGGSGEPWRDGSIDSYLVGYDVVVVSNEGKGIGSFILASTEYEAYKKAKQQN